MIGEWKAVEWQYESKGYKATVCKADNGLLFEVTVKHPEHGTFKTMANDIEEAYETAESYIDTEGGEK